MASPFLSARPDPGISAEIRREFPLEYAEPEFELADIVRLYGDGRVRVHQTARGPSRPSRSRSPS
jgi:hypothetical protein